MTVESIEEMNYTDFVSLIREENRPPGGKATIREILNNSFLNRESKVLEVGCTNGFTSLEISRILECEVIGVDINEKSLINAQKRVKKENVKFQRANAYNLPFKDNYFDLVICGNATSFMPKKKKAVEEYIRVVKDWGFVVLTPMYYIKEPPKEIVDNISEIIGTKIDIIKKEGWLSLFEKSGLEVYYSSDYVFKSRREEDIQEYSQIFTEKPHLSGLSDNLKFKIQEKWGKIMKVFNDNIRYVGYPIILLRKREEKEFFTSISPNRL